MKFENKTIFILLSDFLEKGNVPEIFILQVSVYLNTCQFISASGLHHVKML